MLGQGQRQARLPSAMPSDFIEWRIERDVVAEREPIVRGDTRRREAFGAEGRRATQCPARDGWRRLEAGLSNDRGDRAGAQGSREPGGRGCRLSGKTYVQSGMESEALAVGILQRETPPGCRMRSYTSRRFRRDGAPRRIERGMSGTVVMPERRSFERAEQRARPHLLERGAAGIGGRDYRRQGIGEEPPRACLRQPRGGVVVGV